MWVHIVIFVIILAASIGWRRGWIPKEGIGGKEGVKLFLLVAASGNLLGLFLSAGSGNGKVYTQGYRLEKEEPGAYEKEFLVAVDGEEAESLYVQIPEKELAGQEEPPQTRKLTEEEKRQMELKDAIARYNQEKDDPDYYYLPESWDGKKLDWEMPKDTTGTMISGLFFIAALILLVMKGREDEARLQKRYEELLMDYPGLIMKFTLLVQAGMTARKAFEKMSLDYKRKKKTRLHFAYDQILSACHEMNSGVSEMEAYRRFGERCGQVKYKTLATLLIQNLQKGSRHLSDMLEREAVEAWEERKRKARVLGEAAATKLLVPMIMMLLVVMALIMIPAFLSFYGGV